MRTKTKVLSLTALVAGGVVFGMILAGSLDITKDASAEKPVPVAATTSRAPSGVALPSFADIADRVMPAVVSVTSTDIVKPDPKRRTPYHNWRDGESPFEFFFGPQGRGMQEDEERKELSGGTGFIVEPDGFVLTNNHVIEGADKVEVRLDERTTYKAKVVGRDPATDLALLKIEGGNGPFPHVVLGDSDRLRVGEWVMAIGDPLQFDKSVTVGVISGKGRYAGLSRATSAFENLIQTDAAINFGNSGGPLVNVNGEVIGINTAISRFAQNIGFAVPINMAKRLLPQLKKGKVVRGFLGVEITEVSQNIREAYELKSRDGALVQNVTKGAPGDQAGLRYGDVIVRVDDQKVNAPRDLIDYISSKAPGTKVTIVYLRDGKEERTTAKLQTRGEDGDTQGPETPSEEKESDDTKLGIRKSELTPALRRSYRVDRDVEGGVVITHVKPVSSAADAGLAEGDVIVEVNGVEVPDEAAFEREMKKAMKGKYVRFYVHRSVPRSQNFIAAVKVAPESD